MIASTPQICSLQDTKYNRFSFKGTLLREQFSRNYFAICDEDENMIFMPLLEQMKTNHKKCSYWKLLKHYCPCSLDASVWKGKSSKRATRPKPSQKVLFSDHCTVKGVFSFVSAVFRKVVPLELLGNNLNYKCFLQNIRQLLCVQKYGEISLGYLVSGIKVSKIAWIQLAEPYKRKDLLLKCVDYLITQMICPLIQSFFCFVDSSYAKVKLFIFRKRVWHRLCHKAFGDFSKFCNLNLISEETFKRYIKEQKCLGCAKINFVLKKSSLRPICNSSFKDGGKVTINQHLKSLLVVLMYEKQRNPTIFGTMGMGKIGFYQSFQEYIMKVKKGQVRKLYYVTADVEKCFDSIDPKVLLDIVRKLLKSDLYVVHRYKKKIYGKNKKFEYFESVFRLEDIQQWHGDVELIREYSVSKKKLLQKAESLLLCNVVKMSKHYYLQKRGISQGSKVSSLLSAAYLGKIEEEIAIPMGFYDFLIRMEDEYFLCSSMKSCAEIFLQSLATQMKVYGLNINLSKAQASFDCAIGPHESIPKSSCIKFWGLTFDPLSFSVISDYSCYEGLKTSDVVTWKLSSNPGEYLKERVLKSLFPKCDTILFDKNVNAELIIQKNVLRIFCMTAMKFHCLVMHLPTQSRIDKNPKFFLDIIINLPAIFSQHISHSLCKFSTLKDKNLFPLSLLTVRNLCNKAFLHKFKKHPDVYKKIIQKIELPVLEKKSLNWMTDLKCHVKEAFKDIHLK